MAATPTPVSNQALDIILNNQNLKLRMALDRVTAALLTIAVENVATATSSKAVTIDQIKAGVQQLFNEILGSFPSRP